MDHWIIKLLIAIGDGDFVGGVFFCNDGGNDGDMRFGNYFSCKNMEDSCLMVIFTMHFDSYSDLIDCG